MKKLIKKIVYWIKNLFILKNQTAEIKDNPTYVLQTIPPANERISGRERKTTNNRKQTKGRNYYFQTIVDKKTNEVKTIKHIRE
jgi:hypothetical protein